jgi:hypothetical protein
LKATGGGTFSKEKKVSKRVKIEKNHSPFVQIHRRVPDRVPRWPREGVEGAQGRGDVREARERAGGEIVFQRGGKGALRVLFSSERKKKTRARKEKQRGGGDSQRPLPRVVGDRRQAPSDRPEPLRQGQRRGPAGPALPGGADQREEVPERRGPLRPSLFGLASDLDVDGGALVRPRRRRRGRGRGGGGSAFVVVLRGRARAGAQGTQVLPSRRRSRAEARGGGGGRAGGRRCCRRQRRTATEQVEAADAADG